MFTAQLYNLRRILPDGPRAIETEPENLRKFQYEPLRYSDSIRVLDLLPGNRDTPLRGKLVEVRTSDKPVFEALSYSWGKPIFLKRIVDVSTGCELAITENLWNALRTLRFTNKSRVIWIDALCINQQDIPEKGHQVAQMDKIYRDAAKVVVWLGKTGLEGPISKLRRIGTDSRRYAVPRVFPFVLTANNRKAMNKLAELAKSINWHEICEFYDDEWFERVWIIQEFLLATDIVLCADQGTISYDLFSRATAVIKLMTRRPMLSVDLASNSTFSRLFNSKFFIAWGLVQTRERFQALRSRSLRGFKCNPDNRPLIEQASGRENTDDVYIHPFTLAQCCASTYTHKCTDDRDRVYGLLALAEASLSLVPDYTLPPSKVFEQLSRASLLSGDLTCLHYATVRTSENASSWVADWRNPAKGVRFGGYGTPVFTAGGRNVSKVRIFKGILMNLKAVVIDRIQNQGCIKIKTEERDENILRDPDLPNLTEEEVGPLPKVLDGLLEMFLRFLPRSVISTSTLEVISRTIIANAAVRSVDQLIGYVAKHNLSSVFLLGMFSKRLPNGKNFLRLEEFMSVAGSITIQMRLTDDDPVIEYSFNSQTKSDAEDPETGEALVEIPEPLGLLLFAYMQAVSLVIAHRNVFTTSRGFLGIGPRTTDKGHIVAVFEGAETPFVLEEVGYYVDEDDRSTKMRLYRVVGECYLHDWMDGKAFGLNSDLKCEDICLV